MTARHVWKSTAIRLTTLGSTVDGDAGCVPEPAPYRAPTRPCGICRRATPESHGGEISTGDIQKPTMLWICNDCFRGMVCP